ncbi:hypothetical protein BJ546DRAFT_1068375 [Cryomyces antarcticus]|uniref:Uncharacterized protein n=1 Tax=Cryomyces antarcticus TaxID=329879 RepID=A0ABR0M191_9PEZI|nr:hypothetical protein LTR39_000634 [Cryomyces antarcticus]KAK5019027.1 hypothetical protein LTR39_000635 [Cryomyces antarcticus]KAK5020497.1 hypothetical protein LTR60_000462 [Cryomyces antarcticus]KAK5020498.1 hypothetical protein LTR60_000463 [Cryomyces antarcticus]KAK5257329.1 hypothetical protein LTR16_000972 [Cryomyces antarcticus]
MSVTQRYCLAHTARSKLSLEASRTDHDLRLLVGHANLLNFLRTDLEEYKHEQQQRPSLSVIRQAGAPGGPKHTQGNDSVIVNPREDWAVEDAKSSNGDLEYYPDKDVDWIAVIPQRRSPSSPACVTITCVDVDEEYTDDMEEDRGDHALTRTSSTHLPGLLHDLDEEPDNYQTPLSPPQPTLEFSKRARIMNRAHSVLTPPA